MFGTKSCSSRHFDFARLQKSAPASDPHSKKVGKKRHYPPIPTGLHTVLETRPEREAVEKAWPLTKNPPSL